MTLASKEHLIVDNEILKNIFYFLKGTDLKFSDIFSSFENMEENNFLLEDGNINYFNENLWFSELFNHDPLEIWKKDRKTFSESIRNSPAFKPMKDNLDKKIEKKLNKIACVEGTI
jgi:hypothetical protein